MSPPIISTQCNCPCSPIFQTPFKNKTNQLSKPQPPQQLKRQITPTHHIHFLKPPHPQPHPQKNLPVTQTKKQINFSQHPPLSTSIPPNPTSPGLLPLLFDTHPLKHGNIGGTVPMDMTSDSTNRDQHLVGCCGGGCGAPSPWNEETHLPPNEESGENHPLKSVPF